MRQPETKEVDPEGGPNKVLSVNCITTPPNTHEELNRPLDSQAASDRLVEFNIETDEESLKDQYAPTSPVPQETPNYGLRSQVASVKSAEFNASIDKEEMQKLYDPQA
eukprot:9934611-Ditylum_brightwellii.AAC.1